MNPPQESLEPPSKSGVEKLRPAWTVDMARIIILLPNLEYKIVSKQSYMTSTYLDSMSRESLIPCNLLNVDFLD